MQTLEIGFNTKDFQELQAAASSCQLDPEEYVRLTLLGQLRGVGAVQTEEARCPRHRRITN